MRARAALRIGVLLAASAGPIVTGRSAPSRLAILSAEDRRAPTTGDLAVIRGGLHAADLETVQISVRALGRLERPDLIPDILPFLKSALPEIRAEAANAIGQAAQGWARASSGAAGRKPAVRRTGGIAPAGTGVSVDGAAGAVSARLQSETDTTVRAALCQTLGRLPYVTPGETQHAEAALVAALAGDESVDARLGVAQGLEALIRLRARLSPPSAGAIAALADLASGGSPPGAARDERVNRVALEALIEADAVSEQVVARAAAHPDPQVRRLAMRAAAAARKADVEGSSAPGVDSFAEILRRGRTDPSPMVRYEALKATRPRYDADACAAAVGATSDSNEHVVLLGIDQLGACTTPDAVRVLEGLVSDSPETQMPRQWHRAAHAIVALAATDPDRARAALPRLVQTQPWELRVYAARAATVLKERSVLDMLARDQDDNVCEAALAGLSKVAGRGASPPYIEALSRRGYQAVRQAALALGGTGQPAVDEAVPALENALRRLTTEGRDNSRDTRTALADALEALGAHVNRAHATAVAPPATQLTAEEIRRLALARSRITIQGVGSFELALFASQAPATVIRFAHLAQTGYYNGLTFHRVVPNFVIQGGSPGANEFVGDASYMRDEVGLWPHVRGALGISTRGRDTGDGQIFIDLVDNPRLDHDYTVFGQVLSGMDVVDAVLEGDVIERVEILP